MLFTASPSCAWLGSVTNSVITAIRTVLTVSNGGLPLKALFSFVDEERETAEADTAETVAPADASLHSRKTLLIALRRPRIWISSAVAAAVVAIVMLVPPMNKAFAPEPQNYAVIDGKVYTSQKVINEQVDEAFQTVTVDNEDPFSALDLMQ